MIAFTVRLVASLFVLGAVGTFAFLSGWVVFSPERPGFGRHSVVDWACPSCELWSTAYVSRFWRERARRRALGPAHAPGRKRRRIVKLELTEAEGLTRQWSSVPGAELAVSRHTRSLDGGSREIV